MCKQKEWNHVKYSHHQMNAILISTRQWDAAQQNLLGSESVNISLKDLLLIMSETASASDTENTTT